MGKDGTVTGLQAMIDGDATFSVQTPPFFGAQTVQVFEAQKAGKAIEPKVQYVPKETFDNDTDAQKGPTPGSRREMKALGVGCCR